MTHTWLGDLCGFASPGDGDERDHFKAWEEGS